MTAVFQKNGVTFQYPENWAITASDHDVAPFEVALESPGGALWMLTVCETGFDQAALIEQLELSLKEQYQDVETSPWQDTIAGASGSGLDADFFCLDFLVTAQIRVFDTGRNVFGVVCQAESRDFQKMEPVFNAILTSLLTSS